MSKNLCNKTVDREHAYEVWQNNRPFNLGGDIQEAGTWTWYVRRKYQSPEKEAENKYARWYCDVVTPIVPEGETGDTYISDIIPWSTKIK